MSYPRGDEFYPTIEQLERNHEELSTAYYNLLNNLEEDLEQHAKEKAAKRPITLNLTVNGDNIDTKQLLSEAIDEAIEATYSETYPTNRERVDITGIAFARALASLGYDDPDGELMRIYQDLFAVLEDRIISEGDKRKQAEYDTAEQANNPTVEPEDDGE